jgi:competence protein ComEC
LLGAREQVDSERTENFVVTGTVHLLVVSGLHVGILASGVWLIGRVGLLSRRATLWWVVGLVIVYALVTGAAPPVIRASIVVVGFCIARLVGRPALSFNLLAGAALFVLAMSPAQLFGTGTQLSFLAASVLVVCGRWLVQRPPEDPLDRLLWQTRPLHVRCFRTAVGVVGRLAAVSAMIWIFAMPLVVNRFHLVSPVGVVLTPLLWIPITVALYSGFGVLVLGWLFPPVGQWLGWLCDSSLWMIESCINQAREVPLGCNWVPAPPDWWVIAFYAGLALCVAIPRVRPPRRWLVAIGFAWLAVGLIASLPANASTTAARPPLAIGAAPTEPLACTFVSVGHGTSVIVELPGGQTLLYDVGCGPSPGRATRATAAALWSRGITHVDAVIVSHADVDHYNGLPELLERVSVGAVYVSPVMFEDETPALTALRSAIVENNVPLVEFSSGDRLSVRGGAEIEVLHPPRRGVIGSDNANSIVLRISYAGRHILLPGDLESPGLEDLLAEEPQACDVVMAPHHGSARSNPVGFAAWSRPRHVIISGGPGADTEAVKRAYRAVGAEVFHTAQQGAVRVVLESDGTIRAQSWRQSPWR